MKKKRFKADVLNVKITEFLIYMYILQLIVGFGYDNKNQYNKHTSVFCSHIQHVSSSYSHPLMIYIIELSTL